MEDRGGCKRAGRKAWRIEERGGRGGGMRASREAWMIEEREVEEDAREQVGKHGE
jgi:hypothetical protein